MTWNTSRSSLPTVLTVVLMLATSATAQQSGGGYFGNSDATAPTVDDAAAGAWVIDPDDAGPNLPPVGRSLFDFLVTREVDGRTVYDVPYPFVDLQRAIAARLGRTPETAFKRTLIPIGRSLQRFAAEPDFFAAPRVIVAVDQDPSDATDGGPLLRDRLFLGFQEKSRTIEIISYNEAAGRFEFQLVHDYGPDSQPRVLYAERRICTQCHQNHAPIFSRPLWNETTASPLVAARLLTEGPAFHGVSVTAGVDPADAIDLSTDRANMLSLYQKIWRDGCGGDTATGIGCRAAGFVAALQYGLSGNRLGAGDSADIRKLFARTVADNWRRIWPGGLALPNPDIPNRDPLHGLPRGFADFADLVEPDGRFDPTQRRPPLVLWPAPGADVEGIDRVTVGLARFFSAADLRRLDRYLRDYVRQPETQVFRSPCQVRRTDDGELRIRCQGDAMSFVGHLSSAGAARRLAFADGDQLVNLDIAAADLRDDDDGWRLSLSLRERGAGLGARLSDGRAIGAVTLTAATADATRPAFDAAIAVEVRDDFAAVIAAVRRMAADQADALSDKPFRRASLMATLLDALDMPARPWCCVDSAMLPPVATE